MVKVIPKELDSISTIPSEEILSVCSDANTSEPKTICNLIEQIPRSSSAKLYKPYLNEITSRKWSPKETLHFYRMLEVVGTDFSLMANLQSRRTKK